MQTDKVTKSGEICKTAYYSLYFGCVNDQNKMYIYTKESVC